MDNYILKVSSWWGLSSKPGAKYFYLNGDGSYLVQIKYSKPDDEEDDTDMSGKIEEDRMKKIVKFLKDNLTQSSEKMIFDAGYTIEYVSEGVIIKIVNDRELWSKIVKLIPEYKQDVN